ALFQPIAVGSREFEDIVKILHSSYLEPSSVSNFTYRKASLVHSELLEKEFTEKRRELKSDGRLEKELSEAYAFLLSDRSQIQSICEKGLQVGHSKITILGSPAMGVYVSRYADLLQPNPLEDGACGDVIVFKIIKGKMKSMYDHIGMKAMESTVKSALDPTPKHECHVSKNANKVTSLWAYRAYELTQYYFYEYVFDEIRRRPRHVCPYAVVSFTYKDSFFLHINLDKSNYTLWRGQLWNKGRLLCHVSLKSTARPFLPCKLPEKLEVEKVVSIDQLKKKVPPALFYKETYLGPKEVLKNGMYCSLYEVVEKSRSGIHLESLLQKLEKEKLVLVKTLRDRGFLFLLSPGQMISPYDHQIGRPRMLHALFLFPETRGVMRLGKFIAERCRNSTTENQEIIPELTKFIQCLQFALIQSRKDGTAELNVIVEKYINEYLRRGCSRSGNYREFVLCQYQSWLDEKTFLYPAPKDKSHIDGLLQNYIFGCEAYQLPVSRAKELMEGERRPQQFSPISDYEVAEDDFDFTTAEGRERLCAQYEAIAAEHKLSPSGDYDPDQIRKLIGLIQCRKKNVGGDSDSEDPRIKSGLKRKLEIQSEHLQKYLKMSESSENRGRNSDLPCSVFSINTALGGHDADLRQQDVSSPAVTDTHGLIKLLLETLASGGHLDSSLAQSVNQALGLSTDEIEEDMRQKYEYESIPAQDKDDHEFPHTAENINYKDQPSPMILETEAACLPYPVDVGLQLSASGVGLEHTQRLKEASTGSVSSFEDYSPCPSMPIERIYRRQHSNSTKVGEVGMHWKLIPITGKIILTLTLLQIVKMMMIMMNFSYTGLKSPEETLVYLPPKDAFPNDPRVINRQRSSEYQFPYSPFSGTRKGTADDGLYTRQVEKLDQCGLADNPFTTKHSISAIIETTLLEEYNLFARKIQEILREKNIAYVSGVSTPAFSARERMMRLSEYICLQASEISVQEYIETLSEKLNSVILSSSCIRHTPSIYSSPELGEGAATTALNPPPDTLPVGRDSDAALSEPLCNNVVEDQDSNEQHSSSLPLVKEEIDHMNTEPEEMLVSDQTYSGDLRELAEKTQKSPENVNISTQPAFSDFISQLKPEVLNSLAKIIKDVQKNIVKFYIHEEEESILCKEIKEYLTKLGNIECHPEQFLKRRADLDKLLIIIQNEDIANLIHKIPGLVTLKRLSCVSFAGVDSLDDVKNHTYNDLFVSGGFVVSDESVLNPESVTTDKLKQFLKFLEDLSTPDGKWQWKVHCKIQKKLKEQGRMNPNALSLLTLLNTYQKQHLVEILSYHNCDSQTRNAPELDCLIRLQAQNIQQRHIVFLTEKNLKTLSNYINNGIVVATVDDFMQNFKNLVGYHNSVTEKNSLPPADTPTGQPVLVESDEKDEEDMSLDSGDETSQIEICSDASKYDTHLEALQTEAKGSHGADVKSCLSVTELPPEAQIGSMGKTSKIDLEEIQPITSVSTTCCAEGEKHSSVEQAPFSDFRVYSRQLNMARQFSHFSVLTHQTFLGTTYPISSVSQNQEGGNYFVSAYSQSADTEQTASPGGWDVNCDSSRPYSNQK
ncbi:TASOR protein, partial [Atlantisia rogersi]|nr:TASOR protein [Atlantisia rogersi]